MRLPIPLYLLGACLSVLHAASVNSNAAASSPAAASAVRLTEAYGKLPLSFEPNLGQAPRGVRYLTRVPGATILLKDTEAMIQLFRVEADNKAGPAEPVKRSPARGKVEGTSLRMRLAGARPPRQVEPQEKLQGISNYFIGRDPKQWRTDIPQYQRVRYKQVYPGVDLVYYGNGPQLQYDFTVEPGAQPGMIQLQFEGTKGLRIEESGDLLLETALGDLRLAKPVVYQESEEGRKPADASYRLLAEGRVGFTVGRYDPSRRLVIDPTLVYSTYLGGASGGYYGRYNDSWFGYSESTGYGETHGVGVAVDAGGNAYITGYTWADDFPTLNSAQPIYIGGYDVFVSKLNSTGTGLVWSTYLGGSGDEASSDIALDASGNAYITGFTESSDFPLVNAAQSWFGGGDAFVAKLSSSGDSLVYSTYLGGATGWDGGKGIAVNPSSGDAYVTGFTWSTDFPVQAAYQSSDPDNGYANSFVAKFNAAGVRQFSTYLGGSYADWGERIALDSSGNVYVTGGTYSDDFPTTTGVVQTGRKGVLDAFVTKMAADGSHLIYSTYLGGSGDDLAYGIAVHSSGSAYITGYTYSADFPTTAGVVQPSLQGDLDAFVAKLNPDGTALSFSTYLGGGKREFALDVAVDEPAGNAYIVGYTYSGNFPVANALQPVKPNSVAALYRTGDGGGSWSPADTGLSASIVEAISVDPGNPATVVATTDNGIYRSTDSGSNWSKTLYLQDYGFSSLARAPSDPNVLYAFSEAWTGEFYQSTDGGASWVFTGTGVGAQPALAVHPTIPGTLYQGTLGGVFRSTDGGASWVQVSNGLGEQPTVLDLMINPSNANVMYANVYFSGGTTLVYKTSDGAASWNAANNGLDGYISALAMNPSNPGVLYAATNTGCVYKTTNAAADWNSTGCPDLGINNLVVAPSNPAVLYAGTYNGVWRSADAGVTLSPANTGITDRLIKAAAIHPTDASVLYTGMTVNTTAFVTKLNAGGTAYVYSTYLGGPQGSGDYPSQGSVGTRIATDGGGNAYMTGSTSSSGFPTTAGALERSLQTTGQAFVAKISDATASCAYDVNPSSQFFYSSGGSASFSVVSPSGCPWTANPGAGWVSITNDSSGSGVGAVSISVGSDSGAARSTSLTVGGQTIAVTQAAAGCSYSLSTSSITAVAGAGSYDIAVTAGSGCDWVVGHGPAWITASPWSGSGSRTVTVSLTANPLLNSRWGQINIGGQYLSITQAGTCIYLLSSTSAALDWAGGARSVDVTCSSPFCKWSASSNASWLTITNFGGRGSGTVNYTVAANNSHSPRSGTLIIAGQEFTVTQAGVPGLPTTTTLAAAPNPCMLGQFVTLTATVSPVAATGRVTFYDGTTVLGVGTLASGTATLATRLLPAGNRSLRAYYGSDAYYLPSTSGWLTQTVNAQPASSFQATANYGAGNFPMSVAVGDFNGDGKTDLAVADANTNNVSVLLGNGNGTFQAAVNYVVGNSPYSVAVGDFNGDGKADLAVANMDSHNVSVLLGNGNGTFQDAVNYDAGSGPYSVAVGDFNGDGMTDLAVANGWGNNVSVLLGNGNGTFQAPVNCAAGSYPISVSVGDFNGDGKADLAVANSNGNNVSVLLGNGNGTFQPAVNYAAGSYPSSVAVGDFNADGKADLAVANGNGNKLSVLLGNGNGTFQAAVNYGAGTSPDAVAVGDFNGDGKADLAAANDGGSRTVSVLLGNGDGTFQAPVNYPVGSYPISVSVGDFNGDGKADLAVANADSHDVSVLLGARVPATTLVAAPNPSTLGRLVTLTATVSPAEATGQVTFYDGTTVLGVGTLANGVATLETRLLPAGNRSLRAYYGGDANYVASTSVWVTQTVYSFLAAVNYGAGASPNSVAVGDFNGDGKADLAVANADSANVSVLLGNGDGTFQAAVNYGAGANPYSVAVGDFNGDGKADLVVAGYISGKVGVLLGNGNGTFQPAVYYTAGYWLNAVTVGDFNGDDKLDLAVVSYNDGEVRVLLGNGNGSFQAAVNYPVGRYPHSVAVGDFNGDGKADLAVANSSSNNVSVLLGNGNGTFQAPVNYAAGSSPWSVAVGDLNGDGKADLAVSNLGGGYVMVLVGNGNGTFQAPVNSAAGTNPWSVAVGDLNGDGKADLAVANRDSNNVSVLLGNGNGTFQSAVNYAAGTSPYSVAVRDFNGDGKADLAVANGSSNNVSILLGASPIAYVPECYTDFNGDGKSDIVWRNTTTGDIDVWFMNGGTVTGDEWLPHVTDQQWQIAGIGDFNGDGNADVLWRYIPTGDMNLWLMNGSTVTSDAWLPRVSDPQWQIAGIGDFSKDGKSDVVWRNTTTGDIDVWFMNGGTVTSDAWLPRVTDQNWQIAGIGDFNSDGGGDIVWRYLPSGDIDVWLMDGSTVTSDAWLPRVSDPQWQINAIGDFNGDGNAEIVWRHTVYGDLNIWFMNGVSFVGDEWLPRVADLQWKIFGPR